MSLLQDAKHNTLRTQLGVEGTVNDLELLWLQSLGATSGNIVDAWWEVFDTATIPAGQFNDRAVAYIVSVVGAPPSDDYNAHWLHYWQNATLAPPVPQPPRQANLQLWFDFSDASQVFEDVAGTIPATNGGLVRRVNDKGTNGVAASEAGGSVPTYVTDNPIGQNAAAGTLAITTGAVSAPTGLAGITLAAIMQRNTAVDAIRNVFSWSGGPSIVRIGEDVLGNWIVQFSAGIGPIVLRPTIIGEWLYIIGTINAGTGAYEARDGVTVFSGTDTYGSFTPPLFTIGNIDGVLGEVLVYDVECNPSELDALEVYFKAKYDVDLPKQFLPDTQDLLHWFDFTDPTQVFKNPPATQQALDGDFIRVVNNKGSNGTPISSASDGQSPILRTGIVNGLQIADYDVTTQTLDAIVAAGHASSSNGLSMAIVFKFISGPFATNSMAAWGSNLARTTAARFGQFFVAGVPGNVSSLGALGADTWYLGAFAFDGALGTDRWQFSGEALQSAALGALTDILAGSTIEIANASVLIQVGEFAVWDGQLTAQEFSDVFSYADEKYGTLPIAPPPAPPAPGNLIHHVEPGDASTVWADAAATIPAIDGGVVARIDNKGTDGTPLATSTGGPIYRTGVLNGTNVIDFSGARLEALAVAAGLTISTTGFTIAMVTRRRASHFGDSILWRWTPFAGTPGPSIRGKFTLNGNFGRTDPLADENLVPDPSVIDQWYLMYWSVDPAGAVDDAKFGSPGPEIITPFGVPTDIAPASDVRYGTSSTFVSHAEAWFWNRPLTLAERAALVSLADTKYGTLPHL